MINEHIQEQNNCLRFTWLFVCHNQCFFFVALEWGVEVVMAIFVILWEKDFNLKTPFVFIWFFSET